MKSFKTFLIGNEYDPCGQEQFQIRHGGWITEQTVAKLIQEGLTGVGERSERVNAKNEEKYSSAMRIRLAHFHEIYGPADDKPPSVRVMKERISKRFGELDLLQKNNPKEYKRTMTAANKKLKMSDGGKLGLPISSNAKTDTATRIAGPGAPNGHIPAPMAFTPDTARHYTSSAHTSTGSFINGKHFVERDVCAGSKEGCRGACLAKSGNYGFTMNKVHMDTRTQRLTHNEASTRHHAELIHGQLSKMTEEGKRNGTVPLSRPAVSDDVGPEIHNEAIKKSFPEVVSMRYTKKMPKGEHNPSGREQTTVSDPGPMVGRTGPKGKGRVIEDGHKENIEHRRARSMLPNAATHPQYMVFNGARGSEDSGGANIDNLRRVRHYEPHTSTPDPGESAHYHHPDGYGRVEHRGHDGVVRSFRYQDHSVVKNAQTVDGESLRPYEHDARIPSVDVPKEKLKTRDGKIAGGIVPSLSVKSTTNKELRGSFFHHIENIDSDGIYHNGHPAEMEAAGHIPDFVPKGQPKITMKK